MEGDVKYDRFEASIREEILNLWDNHAASHVYIVSLLCYRTTILGYVKCDKFFIASIPQILGKSVADLAAKAAIDKAWSRNT